MIAPPFIDVTAPGFRFDSPCLLEAAEAHWYARTPMGPLVLRYEEANALLADRRLSPTGSGHLAVHNITEGPIHEYFSINLSSHERAGHARLRGKLTPYLTSGRLHAARTATAPLLDQLADGLATSDAPDFLATFADPLAISLFCELLGVPLEDYDRFGPWSSDVGLIFGLSLVDIRERVEDDLEHLFAYFATLLDDRRARPTSDFVSAIANDADADRPISTRQCLSALISLIMGGHDAPMHQLAVAIATFAEHPEQWDILAADPSLAAQATEEVLRWSSHTHTMRFALEDLEFNGLRLARGDLVITANLTANRDPRAFDEPGRFDITVDRSQRPIAFGGGPYFCPGHRLATLELADALAALAQRFHAPEIVGETRWRPPTTTAYGPEVLPTSFTSRATPSRQGS